MEKKKKKAHMWERERENKQKHLNSYDPQIENIYNLSVVCLSWALMYLFLKVIEFLKALMI